MTPSIPQFRALFHIQLPFYTVRFLALELALDVEHLHLVVAAPGVQDTGAGADSNLRSVVGLGPRIYRKTLISCRPRTSLSAWKAVMALLLGAASGAVRCHAQCCCLLWSLEKAEEEFIDVDGATTATIFPCILPRRLFSCESLLSHWDLQR